MRILPFLIVAALLPTRGWAQAVAPAPLAGGPPPGAMTSPPGLPVLVGQAPSMAPAQPLPPRAAAPPQATPPMAPPPAVGPGLVLTDWIPLDPENTLVIETTKGRIVIALRPEFAPLSVARFKRLARAAFYDGLLFHRVVEGFMAQTGNPDNKDGGRSAEPDLPPEFTFRLGAEIPRSIAARPQGESQGFIGASPYVSVEEQRMILSPDRRVAAWGAYCAGVVGMGRQADPYSGNSQFFIMRQTTRSLDRDYAPVGRVVAGLDVVRALNAGDPPLNPDKMIRVRVLADLPENARPRVMVLNTLSPQFMAIVNQARLARGADFSICDVEPPVLPG